MGKAKILQFISVLLLVLGLFLLSQFFTNKSINVSLLSAIGPIIIALALFWVSMKLDKN